ncbi:MAG: hypothetical protein GX326_05500 [Clostridiaceae bacterium]|nr:hypothetical protein [Clostridiaceae bacterium]
MAFIFGSKRKDGKLVKDGDPINHVMPYVMRNRNESVIYYQNQFQVKPIRDYIKKQRKQGNRITMFNVFMTTILHILVLRPHLNRFIAGRRIYEHDSYESLYVVKLDMADHAHESVARVSMDKNDNIYSIADKMQAQIDIIRQQQEEKSDDKLIHFFTKTPRWFQRFTLLLLRWVDFHGWMPKSLMQMIPLYSSVYVSHLGSIGGHAPLHHLYEVGTNSIFITLGKIFDHPTRGKKDEVIWQEVIDVAFTIDERICDGYYLIKSLNIFDRILENPDLLELTPNEMSQYMESNDIIFGNQNLKISDQLKEKLGVQIKKDVREFRTIFTEEEIIDS